MVPSSMPSASSEANEFYGIARAIQHRSGLSKASFATEDCCFREYFGVSVIVALAAWRLLVKQDLLPDKTKVDMASPEHMLWVMYFLKCYSRTGEGCGAAGGLTRKNSAVDPKTWRKYIWPMIYSLSDLESIVVSHFTGQINSIRCTAISHYLFFRFVLMKGGGIPLMTLTSVSLGEIVKFISRRM